MKAALQYWSLVFVSVFFICSAGSCSLALVQKVQAQEIHVIPPLNTPSDIEWVLDKLVQIHSICWEAKGCTVIPRDIRFKELKEIDALRRRVKELERPASERCS